MRNLIPTLTLVLGAMLILTAAPITYAADEETTRTDPRVVKARQEDERCAELAKHKAVVRRQRKEWKTPIDADGEAALRVWDTICRDWQKRHHLYQVDAADIEHNLERAGIRYRSTTDCLSTWHHGSYSSRLTTTCTSY